MWILWYGLFMGKRVMAGETVWFLDTRAIPEHFCGEARFPCVETPYYQVSSTFTSCHWLTGRLAVSVSHVTWYLRVGFETTKKQYCTYEAPRYAFTILFPADKYSSIFNFNDLLQIRQQHSALAYVTGTVRRAAWRSEPCLFWNSTLIV